MSIALPHTITPGTVADASQVQENFDALADGAVDKTGDTLTGDLNTEDLLPVTDATYDLGSSGHRYKDLYISGSIIGPAGANSFGTVAVSGQTNVVADSANDTLNIAAGTGIALTTTPGTDTVTISSDGGEFAVGPITALPEGMLYNYQSATGVGNINTGEDTLYTKTLAAGILANDGDALRLEIYGNVADNANTKIIRFKFGASTFYTAEVQGGTELTFFATATIVRLGASSQLIATQLQNYLAYYKTNLTTASENLASTVALVITGEGGTTDDIKVKGVRIVFSPNAPNA